MNGNVIQKKKIINFIHNTKQWIHHSATAVSPRLERCTISIQLTAHTRHNNVMKKPSHRSKTPQNDKTVTTTYTNKSTSFIREALFHRLAKPFYTIGHTTRGAAQNKTSQRHGEEDGYNFASTKIIVTNIKLISTSGTKE